MLDAPLATHPDRSFSVLASAGTGKTWQLVSRLIRLLLSGASLDSILAITFTRKAAGEMQLRVNERLQELLAADNAELDCILESIGETPSGGVREMARNLLEQWLRAEYSLRTTTFHSFCLELLRRFPLEAGLPPAFEVAEQTGALIEESWDALFSEATTQPDSPLAQSLEQLLDDLNGLHNLRRALFEFVEHRSDWWAFTDPGNTPVASATRRLEARLETDLATPVGAGFWTSACRSTLAEFAALIGQHATKMNERHAAAIVALLARDADAATAVADLQPIFFTASGERRKRGTNQAQRRAMGTEPEARFLELHDWFCSQLERVTEQLNRQRTLRTNAAWYCAGQRMLEHYQRIKQERRLLDFSDLEWHTLMLLRHPEHADWVQYKLDQRIDHLLIDEFQDTNPTQWQLIAPLLEEMAASSERWRTLFIVGDAKQSIYRFRRGNPELLNCAANWMQRHLGAQQVHLDASRRSSPAILDVVNRVFLHPEMQRSLASFAAHSTHRDTAWGRVELWPPFDVETIARPAEFRDLRNPLCRPRQVSMDTRHYLEGQAIAQRIRELTTQHDLKYGDMLILLRSRTHLADYEAALRDCEIPYLSLDRGTLLESLEIRDLEALLVVLMTPQDDLSFVQLLRSPIFSATDDDLMLLAAEDGGSWIERLYRVGPTLAPDHRLARAAKLITAWRQLAGRIPIHDMLERIFHEANVTNRYTAAFPATEVPRVSANLNRFIELALEVDSGRYPTLPRFLSRIRQLRNLDREGPNQATPAAEHGQRVRILTIHAAKGLEAPVVFLADSTNEGSGQPGCQALVRWPADQSRPTDFLLLGNLRQRDDVSKALHALEQEEEQRESANLLYVALTRAKNMLVISGCAKGAQGRAAGWYQQIATALCGRDNIDEVWAHEFLNPPPPAPTRCSRPPPLHDFDPRLREAISYSHGAQEIAPSQAVDDAAMEPGDPQGALRGVVIHRLLQLATEGGPEVATNADLQKQVAAEIGLDAADPALAEWWSEVQRLLDNRDFGWLFSPPHGSAVYNEIPIQYLHGQQTVFGVIDRLVRGDGIVHLVDYKTHRVRDKSDMQALAQHYRAQLTFYCEGVSRLWPDHQIKAGLLFTHAHRWIEVNCSKSI